MTDMDVILALGGGVNSTAASIEYIDEIDRVLFAETYAEDPATYAYMDKYLKPFYRRHGKPFHVVYNKWNEPLPDHYIRMHEMPNSRFKMCTTDFKIRPMRRFLKESGYTAEKPCTMFLGISHEEKDRALPTNDEVKYIQKRWPLVEDKIDRDGCEQIIRDHGWPVPPKSGCMGCYYKPYKKLGQLHKEHPDVFDKYLRMEEGAKNFPRYKWHRSGKPLRPLKEILSLDQFVEPEPLIANCESGHCGV